MEEAYVVVCTADKSRTGGKAGRINFQNDSQRIIWGMLCGLSGAALEKKAAELCTCKAGISRICVYHLQGAGGLIFLSETGSGYGKDDGG